MAFDFEQMLNQQNQNIENQIAALQPQTKPQGGVLNQIDPTWLALAQGFLAPTKTGGFGESLSNAAGQLQGPLAQMRQQQMSAQDKINNLRQLQMKMQLDWYKAQKGGEDDSLALYRDLRNERMIENLYGGDLKDINDEIKDHKKTLKDPIATDEAKAEAKAGIDAANARRQEIQAKIDSLKNQKGIEGRARPATPQPQAAQPQPSGALTKEEVLKEYPDAVQENGKWIVVKDGKRYEVGR